MKNYKRFSEIQICFRDQSKYFHRNEWMVFEIGTSRDPIQYNVNISYEHDADYDNSNHGDPDAIIPPFPNNKREREMDGGVIIDGNHLDETINILTKIRDHINALKKLEPFD